MVREAVLSALPECMTAPQWLLFLPDLTRLFQDKLYDINPRVGLKEVEIEYAVGGFSDVCHAFAYALVRARAAQNSLPDFRTVYTDWLSGTGKVFIEKYTYDHHGQIWNIQLVAHAYGRMGLIINISEMLHRVYDPILVCPAEGLGLDGSPERSRGAYVGGDYLNIVNILLAKWRPSGDLCGISRLERKRRRAMKPQSSLVNWIPIFIIVLGVMALAVCLFPNTLFESG